MAKTANPRRLVDNLAGLDARRRRVPIWLEGIATWCGGWALGAIGIGLVVLGLLLLLHGLGVIP